MIATGGVLLFIGGLLILRRMPKKLKPEYFTANWRELQSLCGDRATWPLALLDADKLLDTALKRRRFKGKSMGERMVSAQRVLTENDSAWYAHNLVKKIVARPNAKLLKRDVKLALMGFRRALRDLGALPNEHEVKNEKF
ncbi:hypothetical protein HY003_02215 [Candidatus Saccharibacteria bacterium]|nr:hypothetical protein [Candidatus Saccharibacteria bacterium]MBI3338091.1 hypothetical protein [Candidatus Saccharibacteria bacterium]